MKSVQMHGEQTLVEKFGTKTDYLNIPLGLNDIEAISAGSDHNVALRANCCCVGR